MVLRALSAADLEKQGLSARSKQINVLRSSWAEFKPTWSWNYRHEWFCDKSSWWIPRTRQFSRLHGEWSL